MFCKRKQIASFGEMRRRKKSEPSMIFYFMRVFCHVIELRKHSIESLSWSLYLFRSIAWREKQSNIWFTKWNLNGMECLSLSSENLREIRTTKVRRNAWNRSPNNFMNVNIFIISSAEAPRDIYFCIVLCLSQIPMTKNVSLKIHWGSKNKWIKTKTTFSIVKNTWSFNVSKLRH